MNSHNSCLLIKAVISISDYSILIDQNASVRSSVEKKDALLNAVIISSILSLAEGMHPALSEH